MDQQAELRGFLASRRARLSPEQAGVPTFGGARRVPGLRREEVAHLAGVSVDYYTRLERGKLAGISDEVLDAVARALQLDDVERDHLFHIARPARGRRQARTPKKARTQVRPEIQRVLDAITVPAFIQNERLDVLAANSIGWALYPHAQEFPQGQFNHLKFQLLDPRARDFYLTWDLTTNNAVTLLRAAAASDPYDEDIIKLVGELSTRSERFRQLWASSHDVLRFRSGAKRYRHPVVGEMIFDFESFEVAGDSGLVMLVYSAAPNTATADALQILANWNATHSGTGERDATAHDVAAGRSGTDRESAP